MNKFLIVYVILQSVSLIVRLFLLASADYPRVTENSRGGDVSVLVMTAGFLLWASILLYGG